MICDVAIEWRYGITLIRRGIQMLVNVRESYSIIEEYENVWYI